MSSSALEAESSSLQSVLELGEALVRELDLEQSNDILGRWMAHHLAGLITAAKDAQAEQKVQLEERCRAAVLEVWQHRNCLPKGCRPFEPVEGVLDTLAALDPDQERPFYYRTVLQYDDFDDFDVPGDPAPRQPTYLEKARRFDTAARSVIRHLIALAVQNTPDQILEWVRLAKEAKLDAPDVTAIIRLVRASEEVDFDRRIDASVVTRTLRSRLKEMDDFLAGAQAVREDLAERLAKAEVDIGGVDSNAY
ncbi:hypothetical protein [Sphingomonas sp.]|jgi:hypothetical protein|uniref:hypothetical protein n=1 Tax=Sphingomonas sp. TaxID=28214 RepID=UPI0035667639